MHSLVVSYISVVSWLRIEPSTLSHWDSLTKLATHQGLSIYFLTLGASPSHTYLFICWHMYMVFFCIQKLLILPLLSALYSLANVRVTHYHSVKGKLDKFHISSMYSRWMLFLGVCPQYKEKYGDFQDLEMNVFRFWEFTLRTVVPEPL